MSGINEEEIYTLTSFEPLPPEDEKTGLRKFIEGFKSKKFVATEKAIQQELSKTSQENVTQNGTNVSNINTDVKRKEQFSKESPVTQGLYPKKSESQGKRQLGELGDGGKTEARMRSRTPSSVLRRLSQLVLVEKSSLQQSQGTNNLKKYWMPDEHCKVCYECGVKFHTFRRRHHCRLCGQIFCSRCCKEVVSGHQIGYTGVFRVCIYCNKVVLTYTSGSDIEKNLTQLKEDLSLVAQPDNSNPAVGAHGWNASLDDPELNRSFDVFGVSAEEANLLKQDSYKDLWNQITAPRSGLEFWTHRVRLRTYSTCFVGRDLMNWLTINRKAPNRMIALQICQGLLDLGWIEPLGEREEVFKDDFVRYTPGPRASGELYYPNLRSPSSVGQGNDFYKGKREPVAWLSASFDQSVVENSREGFHKSSSASTIVNQDIFTLPSRVRSLSCENIVVKVDPTCKQTPPCKSDENSSECPNAQSPNLEVFVNVEKCHLPIHMVSEGAIEESGAENDVTEESKTDDRVTAKDLRISSSEQSEERLALEKLSAIHDKHISAFLVQLLDRVGLCPSWKDIIEPLAIKICQMVVPNVQEDDEMDIRHYVKIKKISGGLRTDCRIVSGVVCTKNVVHKKMASSITRPLILMLAFPVDFQRVENRMASLDSLVLQEQEFLKNMVGRIVALKPSLVLVEKTVSRVAQDMLLAAGISVVLNIKPKLMTKISRCVEGDVLPSLDQGSRPKLGSCKKFKIEKFVLKDGLTKTLAFFEGCNPNLGATVVLRGAERNELAVVRDVLRFMVFVAYNSKLEKAFIMDEFGTPFVQEEDDENTEDVSRQENKVVFTVEGETALDNEHMDEPETSNESHFILKDNDGISTEASECVDIENQNICVEVNKSDILTNDVVVDTKNQTLPTKNQTLPTNVVSRESFQYILDNVVLSSSPLVKYPLPYVLTNEGKHCELSEFMRKDIYWSPLFFGDRSTDQRAFDNEVDSSKDKNDKKVFFKETHPFVFAMLNNNTRDLNVLELLANFRAEGNRISLHKQDENCCKFVEVGGFDGIKRDRSVQGDEFVPTNGTERTESDQHRENLPLLRDCFDPFLHQMIPVMFSSYSRESANFPRPCITPWTVFMEFYARNDITLGCFLERYCFKSTYVCPNPNCDVPMVKHVRYFAHGDGAVYINMKNLEAPIPGFSKILLTWSWCKICKQVTPVVPVSPEAWRLSFAKYLELKIYASSYKRRVTEAPCDHSLHQDHYQYFALNHIVASLKYVPLNIYEVHLPPSTITIIDEERQPQFWIQHIQAMSLRVYQLINLISDRIALLKTEAYISTCVTDIAYDKGQLDEKIKVLDSKAMLLHSPPSSPGESEGSRLLEPHEASVVEYEILDGITLLKRMMCEYGEKWNAKLVELFQLENEKKKTKSLDFRSNSTQILTSSPIETSQMTDDSVFSKSTTSQPLESSRTSSQTNPLAYENKPSSSESDQSSKTSEDNPKTLQDARLCKVSEQNTLDDDLNSSFESEGIADSFVGQRGFSNSSSQKIQKHSKHWATLTEEVSSTLSLKDVQYVEDRPGPKMKRIIFQFLPGVSFRSIPSPFPAHEHHLLPVSEEVPIVVNEREPTSIIAYTLSSPDYLHKLLKIQESMEEDSDSFTCIDAEPDGFCVPSEGVRSRARTRSEAETLSSTSLLITLEDDFVENYFQWTELDEDNDVKDTIGEAEVNSSEPNEIGLDDKKISAEKSTGPSHTMENKANKNHDKNGEVTSENSKDTEVSLNDGLRSAEESFSDGKTLPNLNSSTQDVEYHIKHSFADSSAKFICIVYFGEQFRKIREAVFPDGEEKYIRSLQYCLKWQATGGKSGSSFSKTADDRFVIKEMSRSEAQSFLNIAPYYFQYIESAIQEKRPTLLAKIFGVYRIACNSKLTNTPMKKDLLVMDNLLYNCKVDQVFDLKGSMRSRYVNMSSEKENKESVLLDENLLEMTAESPLYMRPHSKAVLSRAINNDTEFLAKHMVMDYSLLLGIEQNSCRVVVGIIDFIRTFTWDKKLEMYVKSTGILGGQGKMPTVVSPELYRERFCEAMQRYFLMIPNKWLGLGNEQK